MGGNTKVFQIVGFQNSGKTTVVKEIIQYWNSHNLKVGTIKHHGHGGPLATTIVEKDSDMHQKAGAAITTVEGNGGLLFQSDHFKWSLQDVVQIYERFSLDLILVEGYKHDSYPKAVMIRNEADLKLLNKLTNIQAVITWIPLEKTQMYPVFSIQNKQQFVEWLHTTLIN